MSYTTPSTAVTGGTLTTTMWNAQLRDNLNYLRTYGTALAGTAGNLVNITATQGSVDATQGSVTATQGSVASINFFFTQPVGTALGSASTAYTLGTADASKILLCQGTASGTVNIPVNEFQIGQKVDFVQTGIGTVTFSGTSGVTLRYTPSNKLRTQNSVGSILKIGINEWLLMGDLY